MTDVRWILVANASRARLLEQRDPGGPLEQLRSLDHPESRQRSSGLGAGPAGHELNSARFGAAAFEPRVDAHRKAHLRFAKELAALLEEGAAHGRCGEIALFASSPFLGELKQALGPAAARIVENTRDVDLTQVGLAELGARVGVGLSSLS